MAHQIPPPGEGYYVPNHATHHPYQYAQGQPYPQEQPYNQGQPQLHAQGQPGPDQSPNWADGLEVVPQEQLKHTQHWPEVRQEEVGKELSPTTALVNQWKYNAGQAPEVADPQPGAKPSRKRLWIILGSVLAVIVIVAAVVGGVVGSKAARDSKSSTAPGLDTGGDGGSSITIPSPSQTTTGGGATSTSAAAVAGVIRSGSPLTVASWRNDKGNVGLYLFYQDKSNDVYYIKYDGSSWGKPVNTITGLRRNTHLTATIILNGLGNLVRPHVILTYIGAGPTVLGRVINENNNPAISNDDEFNNLSLNALANSSTTSYFPAAVYQDPSGELGQARVVMLHWLNRMTGIMALPGTRLAMAPISSRWANYSASGGYGLIYQEPSGRLAAAVLNLGPDSRVDAVSPWFNSSIFPSNINPPNGAPLTAWVTSRPSSPSHFPNTYILYLDSNSNIQMVYTSFSGSGDGSVTWKTSEPEALKGLDKDTEIGCVLMASIDKDQNGNEVPIEEDSEEVNRCFFQKGGKLVEARMSGSAGTGEWKIVGEVPLPS
ncbi:hypothetical protein B0H65DRAFT_76111 [Neurospora tetraspora]|uniref:Fucose-specific lectin n=1 Tax=Neurospora tetraspora TaxID=94610 RepID=A0AAE0J061_9PEZI|nr:hypothetical protein B0H65DRAFT_76111 [Neurospora tetraspora]